MKALSDKPFRIFQAPLKKMTKATLEEERVATTDISVLVSIYRPHIDGGGPATLDGETLSSRTWGCTFQRFFEWVLAGRKKSWTIISAQIASTWILWEIFKKATLDGEERDKYLSRPRPKIVLSFRNNNNVTIQPLFQRTRSPPNCENSEVQANAKIYQNLYHSPSRYFAGSKSINPISGTSSRTVLQTMRRDC